MRIRPLKQEERARGYTEVATKVDNKVKRIQSDYKGGEGQGVHGGGHQGGHQGNKSLSECKGGVGQGVHGGGHQGEQQGKEESI